jgi:hypothetical protein
MHKKPKFVLFSLGMTSGCCCWNVSSTSLCLNAAVELGASISAVFNVASESEGLKTIKIWNDDHS